MSDTSWPATNKALAAEGDLLPSDLASIRTRQAASYGLGLGLSLGAGLSGLMLAVTLDAPTLTVSITAFLGLGASVLLFLAWCRRADRWIARRVRSLGGRRRDEAHAARTIGALGAGGESVAVPGIVDERVREARR